MKIRILEMLAALAVVTIIAMVALPRVLGMREKGRAPAADALLVALDGEIAKGLDSLVVPPDSTIGQVIRAHQDAELRSRSELAYVHDDSSLANVGIPNAAIPNYIAPGAPMQVALAAPAAPAVPLVPQPRVRQIVYDARASLAVDELEPALRVAKSIAEEADGWVESRAEDRIVLRVPAQRFAPLFDRLLALGQVLRREVRAEDVTDRYRALELRLRTARATRDRLTELLRRASTDERKVELLAEIRRLTETLSELEAERARVARDVAFSRVTLVLVARVAVDPDRARGELASFAWIHRLSPTDAAVAAKGTPLVLRVPPGMVALDPGLRSRRGDGPWVAESADGAVLRASAFVNDPHGSSAFWAEAIEARLSDAFASSERLQAGGFELVRFTSGETDGPRYLVGVQADGDELRLVEISYPSAAQEERHADAVLAALASGLA